MHPVIVSLDDLRAGDTSFAGGKGANLGELASRGFPVPPGFVLTTHAFAEVLDSLDLREEIRKLDDAPAHNRASAIQQRIIGSELSPSLANQILDAHARLAGDRDVSCAVRSSATAEDLAGASFAGQHGTYYYVDSDRLLEMIRRCWASLWSAEAVEYRASRGIAHEAVTMAVVVQEMVRSDVSGIAFTANPVSGARDEIVIESSWGMGAAIVDGRVTPDRFVVAREGLHLRERRIADKQFMILPRLVEGSDERLAEVPAEQRCRETLSDDEISTVAEWSLQCEAHFGTPQDVEWAIAGGRFHLLQSRPITTLQTKQAAPVRGKFVLFKAIAENFTDPLTPLTADLLTACMPPMICIIGGRPYFDLDRLRPLIPFDLSDEELADLFYLRAKPAFRISPARLPLALAAFVFGSLTVGVLHARTRGMPDDFMDGYRSLCRRVEEDGDKGPLESFLRLWLLPNLFEPVGYLVLWINGSFIRMMPWRLLLDAMLRRWLIALPSQAISLLCSGSEGILSADMGREVEALAAVALATPGVADIISSLPPAEALARLRDDSSARDFTAALDRFLAVHGHRALKEFELRSPRWEENPAPVIAMIRNHLGAGARAIGPSSRHANVIMSEGGGSQVIHPQPAPAIDARGELEIVIRSALERLPLERRFRLRWRLIRGASGRVRYFLKLRENSRSYHIMGLGVVRKKILGIESELLREGKLKCRDDVFFLRFTELEALQAGRLAWRDIDDRIRERRLEHLRVTKTPAARTIGVALRAQTAEPEPKEILTGQSASPGTYAGLARVILDPAVDATLQPGEVLVAPYTDPGWTPLFLSAGAAVVEVGSYLSHAGTVAREYRMPCVVDVAHCTRRIRTGMRVEVDGDRGIVRILDFLEGGSET
ncbi:MAG TPA: PEP/pyruvate-binding domain-containing protein [Thermoanaerobaculia bacterium]|nr:PEP/pyruvate-binding domain-containing protein [Thermoanaerobaculia bacterium]